MDITIKGAATVPAGTYQAEFEGIEEKTSRDGAPYLRWVFEAMTVEGRRSVSGVSSTNTGQKAKAYRWLAGLLGRAPTTDETISTSDLIGTRCLVVLEENADGFANVADVLPPPRLSEATVATYAAQADGTLDELPF